MRKVLISSFIGALLIVLGGIWFLYGNLEVDVKVPPSADILAAKETIKLSIETNKATPFTKIKVFIQQDNKTLTLYEGDLQNREIEEVIKTKEAGFKDGKAELIAELIFPFHKEIILKKEIVIDTTPPSIDIVEKPRRLIIGEPGVVAVKTSPDVDKVYVQLGKAKFYLLPFKGNIYKTIITAPLFLLKKPQNYYVIAIDKAGNIAERFLPIQIKLKKFHQRKIYFDKETLERIVLKFFPTPDNLLEKFQKINTKFRQEADKKLVEICKQSENRLYAKGRFLQLPGSEPTAYYGDHRYYYYNGKLIGESVHKGIDLAKYRHAPVVAANSGRVVFTGRITVYGNTIIIDHGYGVFTLYGHLNDFTVKVGEEVKKGQVIGHTDTTGLALGDHLHFGVLIWGYAANPLFFFDGHYLNYYFYKPLLKQISP